MVNERLILLYKVRCVVIAMVAGIAFGFMSSITAQDQVDVRSYVAERIEAMPIPQGAMASGSFRSSYIEEVQLRTETDEFNLGRQEYLLRLRPTTRRIRRSQRRLHRLYNDEVDLILDELRVSGLRDIYDDWIVAFTAFTENEIFTRSLVVLRDMERVTSRLVTADMASVVRLIDIENERAEINHEIAGNSMKIKRLIGTVDSLDTRSMISLEDILAELAVLSIDPQIIDREYTLEQELIQADIELEKAERSHILDFVEMQYRGPHDNLLAERLSIGVGLEIPTGADTRLKIAELEVEQQINQYKYDYRKRQRLVELEEKRLEIEDRIEHYFQASDTFSKLRERVSDIISAANQSQISDPLILLEQERKKLSHEAELLDMYADILTRYVRYLDDAGKLYRYQGYNALAPR